MFCEEIRKRLDASECRSFSGKVESITALFEAIQLGAKDCVYLSALAPGYIVRAVIACGAIPVFCDVTADGFVMDHKSLAEAVRQTVSEDKLYPRAVIAEHFCGLPFPIRAIRDVCDRMGLFLIEDCGFGFGCSWDGMECGCLVAANGANEFGRLIGVCDGSGWDTADEIYGQELLDSLQKIPRVLSEAESAVVDITDTVKKSDFWMSRGGGRQKSSCSAAVLIAQSEACRDAAVAAMESVGMPEYVRKLHIHRRACFEHGCRGFKTLENASALAPRAFAVDIFRALHTGKVDRLKDVLAESVL